ncbi:XdhC family protein [Thermophilibacter immobilis]|uniref:XdhC family protein n=1 Tax=Thermophilibacter immobilis TaxID=2779519 RepID=A0A7S7RT49_9ACTN|nr:XdhC/CoxI family protein [Thermophilibacter immobilis]QOY59806.1 XdhC family protein [Thermophilibacter immobilis]
MGNDYTELYRRHLAGESFNVSFVPSEVPETAYVRRFQSPARLIVLGGGYVGQSVCRFASALEFQVVVVDDRPAFANRTVFPDAAHVICDGFAAALARLRVAPQDFVVIVTRGHKHDAECLRVILAQEMPRYVGLIGSRRRVRGLFDLLAKEGFDQARMDLIHTPIGVAIGAVTPDEIGISILAELIASRSSRGERGDGLLEQTNCDPVLLAYLAQGEACALALVVGRHGSTPVKTGALMAVDSQGQTFGTIGGGCGEHEVVMAARRVLRRGADELVCVDMTNDVSEDEGMVCGGTMDVLIKVVEAAPLGASATAGELSG